MGWMVRAPTSQIWVLGKHGQAWPSLLSVTDWPHWMTRAKLLPFGDVRFDCKILLANSAMVWHTVYRNNKQYKLIIHNVSFFFSFHTFPFWNAKPGISPLGYWYNYMILYSKSCFLFRLHECQVCALLLVCFRLVLDLLTLNSNFHSEKKCSQVRLDLPPVHCYIWHMKVIAQVYLEVLVITKYMTYLNKCAENSSMSSCVLWPLESRYCQTTLAGEEYAPKIHPGRLELHCF